jgi:DNA-binding transcriptional ArsR family regulator
VKPRQNSQPPDPALPAAFAFRSRHLLGVSARAEAVRILLGVEAPRVTTQAVAASAGYSKRNVHEALAALQAAGVVDVVRLGNEQRFGVPRERWAELLALPTDELPQHRDWPVVFYALRMILRWLADHENEKLSGYMRASEARQLVDQIAADLRFAGIPSLTPAPKGRTTGTSSRAPCVRR